MPTTTGRKGGGCGDARILKQHAELDEFLPRLEARVGQLSARAACVGVSAGYRLI
jgi:hypothetical protein